VAHGQVDGYPTAEGVAEQHDGWQPGCFEPVGQVPGMLGDVQDPARFVAELEAGQVDHGDGWWLASRAANGTR